MRYIRRVSYLRYASLTLLHIGEDGTRRTRREGVLHSGMSSGGRVCHDESNLILLADIGALLLLTHVFAALNAIGCGPYCRKRRRFDPKMCQKGSVGGRGQSTPIV